MFFSISKQKDNRFLNNFSLGNFYFNCDNGWVISENKFFKGYKTPNCSHGNWTEVILTGERDIRVDSDGLRSYPLWWDNDNKILTNLNGNGERIWADTNVSITKDFILKKSRREFPEFSDNIPITLDNFLDWIIKNLNNKVNDFFQKYEKENLKFFPTGGIDTGTIYALLKYNKKDSNVDVINYEYFYYDNFCNKNIDKIQNNYWAYKQIHHWKEKSFLLSGGCGDEFWFRGPYTISIWSAWHDINLPEILQKNKGYHTDYFFKEKNINIFQKSFENRHKIQEMYPTYESLKNQILNINANDHQHWHLNNTITWTPFKDLKITNKILLLPFDDILNQIIDASLNKKVIKELAPEILSTISETKNLNSREKCKIF